MDRVETGHVRLPDPDQVCIKSRPDELDRVETGHVPDAGAEECGIQTVPLWPGPGPQPETGPPVKFGQPAPGPEESITAGDQPGPGSGPTASGQQSAGPPAPPAPGPVAGSGQPSWCRRRLSSLHSAPTCDPPCPASDRMDRLGDRI